MPYASTLEKVSARDLYLSNTYLTNKLVWKRIFRAVWKDFSTRFDGILKSLARHKDLVECRASLTQYRRYQEDITGLKAKIDGLVKDEHNKKATRVKEWLATGAQSIYDHERFLAEREPYPSTGRWILDHEIISDWMNAEVPASPIVWMTGMPGAGKPSISVVMLLCLLIDNIREDNFGIRCNRRIQTQE